MLQDKEKLLTDLRKVLSITNDQHYQFLEEVEEDKLVIRLREAKNPGAGGGGGVAAGQGDMGPPRQPPPNPNRKAGRPSSGVISVSPPVVARPPRSVLELAACHRLHVISFPQV